MKWISENLKWIGIALLAIFAFAWLAHDRQPAPEINKTVIAKPAPEVKALPKIEMPLKKPLKVYSGGATLKEKLGLPPEVVKDDNVQVISSSKIEGEQPLTVTGVVNKETGDSEVFVRTDPQPWLAWDDHGGVGIYAIYKNGAPSVRLQGHQELFRIKSFHVGLIGSIEQSLTTPSAPDTVIGGGGEWRW